MVLLEVLAFNGDYTRRYNMGVFDTREAAEKWVSEREVDELPIFPEFVYTEVEYYEG